MAQISRDRNSSVSGTERVCGSGKGVEGLLEQSKNHWEREEEADVCLKVRCANESADNRADYRKRCRVAPEQRSRAAVKALGK